MICGVQWPAIIAPGRGRCHLETWGDTVMPVTRTHTKTYALLDPWASTIPWDCLVRDTGCCHPTHDHDPMVGDPCAVEDCRKPLVADETCYAVVQYRRITRRCKTPPAGYATGNSGCVGGTSALMTARSRFERRCQLTSRGSFNASPSPPKPTPTGTG
jgi:hypothetical protein